MGALHGPPGGNPPPPDCNGDPCICGRDPAIYGPTREARARLLRLKIKAINDHVNYELSVKDRLERELAEVTYAIDVSQAPA